MKNIIFLFTFLASLHLFSQESYPHKRPELMLGKQVKVLPMSERDKQTWHGYENFYSNAKSLDRYKSIPGRIETKPEALEGRIFTVTKVEKQNGFDSTAEKDYKYIYTLEDVKTKEVLYYIFLPGYDRSRLYYLEVIGGLDLPADFYCDYIDTMVYSEKRISYSVEAKFVCNLEKNYDNGKIDYELKIELYATAYPGKGYTITMENGTVLSGKDFGVGELKNGKPFAIHFLTLDEMKLLSKYKITEFSIRGGTYKMSDRNMTVMKEGAKCLLTK